MTGCKKIVVWGRSTDSVDCYKQDMGSEGYEVESVKQLDSLASKANLIVTTTPSSAPLISQDMVKQGTLIIAIGSDTPEKQELEKDVLANATRIIVDSKRHCLSRGEASKALDAALIGEHQLLELGVEIEKGVQPTKESETTIVDLTGVAVQDLKLQNSY